MHDPTADPLDALGDGSRRAILRLLCERERSVGEIVASVGLSQPAVSQHLRVLREAELVAVRAEGRLRVYRAAPEGLARLRDEVDAFWRASLARMKTDLESPATSRGGTPAAGKERPR
jgi:DNA-binding transcriptional ArsR family regulator